MDKSKSRSLRTPVIPVRLRNREEHRVLKRAAKRLGVSMNRFMLLASLRAALAPPSQLDVMDLGKIPNPRDVLAVTGLRELVNIAGSHQAS